MQVDRRGCKCRWHGRAAEIRGGVKGAEMAQSNFNADAQGELWIESGQIARSPGHPFYARLNQVLRADDFDRQAEALCAPYYKEGGRPALPAGGYFRLLLAGHR